jgi:hypothetical protein
MGHWDQFGRWRDGTMRSIVRGRIMTYMAGRAAEEEFFDATDVGDDDDRRQINFMFDRAYCRLMRTCHATRHVSRPSSATLQPDEIEQAMAGEMVKASRSL